MQFGRACRLAPQIKFAQGPAFQIGDNQLRPQPCCFTAQRLQMRGRPFIGFNVAGELLTNTRAKHLDCHILAFIRAGTVYLRDGGGTNGDGIDIFKQSCRGLVQAVVDLRIDLVKWRWR